MVCCSQIHEVLQFPNASFTPQLSVFLAQLKRLLDSRLHMLLWQPFPQALRSEGHSLMVEWDTFLICAHFCAVMHGLPCSQARLRAQTLCGTNVKRTINKHGGLTLWPALHKPPWHRARFVGAADMKDKVTSECEETKEAPFSSALQWVWHISLPFRSLQNKACARVSSRLQVRVFAARKCASRFSFPMAPRSSVAGC